MTGTNHPHPEAQHLGIRPALGYPACPDHTEKDTLWELLEPDAEIGLTLSESKAMVPTAAVSGVYFANPESRYFALGKIDRGQVEEYAERKGMSVEEVERCLVSCVQPIRVRTTSRARCQRYPERP